ncbi:MAG: DUF2784 family protein [Calditrichaeota bacterium]|nr:MAG: DUF2784 family protein [Calditrichota bacterium]MBL1205106.1 DUF2784 family protein [Calditrichota bacterium]NOG44936.1 DUF2784 domain-containing protein [Calditrichota bacterium]
MLEFLNILFHFFHILLIVFNLTGWIFPKIRKAHLISVLLTFVSWFGLGIFYGWGYCPSTDWHWQVQRNLGITDLPNSYIKYLYDAVTGFSSNPFLIDVFTLMFFLIAFSLSIWFNFFCKAERQNNLLQD